MKGIIEVKKLAYDSCVGCKVCETICPVQAIVMKRNQEGFEMPEIIQESCIDCKKCEKVCPALNKKEIESKELIYAARCKDKEILLNSSSGGAFSVLAQKALEVGGVVYGVVFSSDYRTAVYARATTLREIEAMRGSKYVEASITQNLIMQFLEDVTSGKTILFTGTGCQINGLQNLCKIKKHDTKNVIWVDFYVCSGKVSSLLWQSECDRTSEKGKLEQVSFRSKKRGWQNFGILMKINSKICYKDFLLHHWNKFLGSSNAKRKSCLKCKYSQKESNADISIGDFWESAVLPKEWNDNLGVSVVSVNTDKGIGFFDGLKEIEYKQVKISRHNPKEKTVDLIERDKFWKIYHNEGYNKLCEKYAKIGWKDKILFGVIRPILIKTKLLSVIKKRKKC